MAQDFTSMNPIRAHIQHVLPLVFDNSLSYYELVSKVVGAVNELIVNNNNVPEYIRTLIAEYINSGDIVEVIRDTLSNYLLNIQYPPNGIKGATPDGTTDSTEAIQACIDYAHDHGGGAVYIPSGRYLTQPLTLKSNVCLFGFGAETSVLVATGGATAAIIHGDVENASIQNIGIDGNMGAQVNAVNVVDLTVKNAAFNNLVITGGKTLLKLLCNGGDVVVNSLRLGNASRSALVIEKGDENATAIVNGVIVDSVSVTHGEYAIYHSLDNAIFKNVVINGIVPVGVIVDGNNNYFEGIADNAIIDCQDYGENNSFIFPCRRTVENFAGERVVSSAGYAEHTHGAKTVNAESYTEEISGAKTVSAESVTETVAGVKTVNAVGALENVMGAKTVNADTVTENVTGAKTVSAERYTEEISGAKTVNADEINLKSVNPIGYKSPVKHSPCFDTVPFKSVETGEVYNVLVANARTGELIPQFTFNSVEEMCDSAADLQIGTVVTCLSNNGMPAESYWRVVEVADVDLMHKSLTNGYTAEYIPLTDTINVHELGIRNNYENCTTEIQWLIDNGFTSLHFPPGFYTLAVTLPKNSKITGAGENQKTVFLPEYHGAAFTLEGDFIDLSNFHVVDVSPYSGKGIYVPNGCYHSVFSDLVLENLGSGMVVFGSMIWNKFQNVNFYGNNGYGLFVSGAEIFFNLNTFYSCRFNNNLKEGMVIDVSPQHDYTNNFIGCNFEQNGKDRFGAKSTARQAVYNAAFLTFVGCYFEYNGQDSEFCTFKNYDIANLIGCIFVGEKHLLNAQNDSYTNFIGCKEELCEESYVVDEGTNARTVFTGNYFTKNEHSIGATVLDAWKPMMMLNASETLDCVYPAIDYRHNHIKTMVNATDGQIMHIWAHLYDTVIDAELTAENVAFNIPVGDVAAFMVVNGKLKQINKVYVPEPVDIHAFDYYMTAEFDIDTRYKTIRYKHNEITSITNAQDGQAFTLYNELFPTTVAASVMANGAPLELSVGSAYKFIVIDGKLIKTE